MTTFPRTSRPAAVLVLVALMSLLMSASAYGQESFTFRVRGYGHGLGMSQYGAKGFADAGYHYTAILRHYYGSAGTDPRTQVVTTPTPEPMRDVNLDAAAISNAGGFTKTTWTIRPGRTGVRLVVSTSPTEVYYAVDGWSTFTASGNSITWRRPDGSTQVFTGKTVSVWSEAGSPPLTQVLEGTGQYNHQYVRFRGQLRLTAQDSKIKLINRLKMNEYLYGVVPRESPASWPMEALKAQAVAARAYSWTSPRTELYTTTSDQVYGGHSRGENREQPVEWHENSRTNAAVDLTKGVVVTYDGVMVRTFFFSTSGGHTENSENVWSSSLAYIRGVPDPYEILAGSPRHTWIEQTYLASDVRSRLIAQGLPQRTTSDGGVVPAEIIDINVTARGVSGRPTRIELVASDGWKGVIQGSTGLDSFKRAFGWGDRWFLVNPKTYRIAGTDRYHTSVQASLQAFGPNATTPAKVAVVVGGFAEPDALAAAGLAGAAGGGPVLLTPTSYLDSRVRAEIERLNVSTVYIVGGTGIVGPNVESALDSLSGVTVKRIGGADRYGTAGLVAAEIKRLKGQPARALVVSGESIVDGVVASNLAYAKSLPVILVREQSVPAASAAALTGVTTTLVVGGTGVISDAVAAGLSPDVKRIAPGLSRYHTAALLGDYLVGNEGFAWNRCYVASGTSLADVLAIGPTAGSSKHPVLLAETYSMPAATKDRLVTKKPSLGAVWVVGGEGALSGWSQTQVEAALE